MDNIIFMDVGEKSSDGVVEILETHPRFAKEGYKVERAQLRALKCPCGKWYHSLKDACPSCGTLPGKAIESMRVADFSNQEGSWALEKKLASNLYSSLVNREIYEQGEKMGAVYGSGGCVVMQGYMSILIEQHPGKENWIWSVVAACPILWGIGFTVVEDDMGMAQVIDAYVKQSRHEGSASRFKVDNVREESSKLAAIRTIKGIGDATAIKAYKKFKTLKSIANASKEQLDEVFHSKAQDVYDLFNDDADKEMEMLVEERKRRKEERERTKPGR